MTRKKTEKRVLTAEGWRRRWGFLRSVSEPPAAAKPQAKKSARKKKS